MTARKKSLWALLLVSLVPLALAFLMYFQQLWLPTSTTNEGELLLPPEQLLEDSLVYHKLSQDMKDERQWRLLINIEGACNQSCLENLHLLRQVHIALGKEAHRVTRILLLNEQMLKGLGTDYPHMLKAKPKNGFTLKRGEGVYLVDPLDNIMMYYTFSQIGKSMLKDIKKLLKNSNIG